MRIEKIIITFLLVLLISFASYAKSLKKIDKLDFSFQDDLNYENLNEAIEKQITHLASGNFEDSFKLDGRKVAKKEILSTLLEFKKIFNLQQERQVKEYIDDNFRIFTPKGKFHFTAYFVPEIRASIKKAPLFQYPLYKMPQKSRYTRKSINDGILDGKNLELAFLPRLFDRYFLHLQGSGILIFPDNTRRLAQCAGSNGYPNKDLVRILINDGVLSRDKASHEDIQKFFKDHPEKEKYYLNKLDRFIFHALSEDGVVRGTNRTPLTTGRSLSMDHKYYPYGSVLLMKFKKPIFDDKGNLAKLKPVYRFVVNQDTGSAMKGPKRGEIFLGTGNEAGKIASRINNYGEIYLFLAKS